jgi:ribosomal protein S18 acetylase RimI-like enzyme
MLIVKTEVDSTDAARGRIRPLDPAHDLGRVADLVGEAFDDELDARGRAALRELRWLSRLSPLVWWLSQADPSFRDAVSGLVWEMPKPGGRGRLVVGNASVNRAPGSSSRHIICNVVVAPDYQRQGIGRQLTERAVAEVEARGGQAALLQVHFHNKPALHLYTDLGFEQIAGEAELCLDAVRPVALVDAPGYAIRPWKPADGQASYELARRAVPRPLQWIRPLRRDEYWPDRGTRLINRLGDLLAGRRTYRLVAGHAGNLVGLATVVAAVRPAAHRLELLVDPGHAGRVDQALISRGLYLLAASLPKPVETTIFADQDATLRVLRAYGFQERRTLLTLSKGLSRGNRWQDDRPRTANFFETPTF